MKTGWGFAQILPYDDFRAEYLVDDKCEFGVEIFVISLSKIECFPCLKEINCGYTWWICSFSTFKDKCYYSEDFTAGGFKW